MTITWAIPVFLGSLALSVVSSVVLGRRLEQVGTWLGLSESLVGLVAALGADSPEIASAITALHAGQHDLGLGIVLGSNIFNVAALLGLSAVVAGCVRARRRTLAIHGSVAIAVIGVLILHLYGWLPAWWALGLMTLVIVPYVGVLAVSPRRLIVWASRLGFGAVVGETVAGADRDAGRGETPRRPELADMLGAAPALAAIVLASVWMVRSAVVIGAAWHIPGHVTGVLILASLTGIPNVVTGVQLARRGRGSAVVSEALNSNTLNLIVGAAIPAAILGAISLSASAAVSLWWMAGMTLLALGLLLRPGGIRRRAGWLLIAIYVVFVMVVIFGS